MFVKNEVDKDYKKPSLTRNKTSLLPNTTKGWDYYQKTNGNNILLLGNKKFQKKSVPNRN